MNHSSRSKVDRREAGFTLIELLITLTITVAVMTVVLTAVDLNANITRVQSDVSDVQQSTRVAQRDMQRIVRMAGRGGLPRVQAIAVTQDVVDAVVGGENALDETDVLTVRGAFSSPVFRVDASDPTTFVKDASEATLLIDSVTKSAFDQPLRALYDVEPGEAILLIGSQGEAVYAVVSLNDEIDFSDVTLDVQNQTRIVERATLKLSIVSDPDGVLQITSAPTPGNFPANLDSVAFAAVLEEYQFFIREDFAIADDPTSRPSPKLARARMLPGTDTLHPDGVIDIADNVYDLQVAFGIDRNDNGRIDVEDGGTLLAASADEWRWNHVDDLDDLAWDKSLQHVRLTIVGQAQTADRQYVSPALVNIENREYGETMTPQDEALMERRHRRRILQSTIDLRNL